MPEAKVAAIIVAAGESRRMGGVDKVFAMLGGKPVLARVIDTFQKCPLIDRIVVVVNAKNIVKCRQLVIKEGWDKVTDVCAGGRRRQDSVAAGLKRLKDGDWVVIHDGARPLVTADLIERGLEAARETGAAVAAVAITDTIKMVDDDETVHQTLPRKNLRAVQTPQVFRMDIIIKAHRQASGDVTDDASLVEQSGHKVKLYLGSYDNIKVTTPEDMALAEIILKKREGKMRVGMGYDVHNFIEGNSLVLGGVEIPFTKKLDGWSDADVLTHAVIDALLGAAALGDIGSHFPSGETQYKGISSLILLERVREKLVINGWKIINIDVTVLAEWPKIGDYIKTMRQKISHTLGISPSQVNVKAETSAKIGYAGRGEGIGSLAVALIEGGKDEGI